MATAAVEQREPLAALDADNALLPRPLSQHTAHSHRQNDEATQQHTSATAVDDGEPVREPMRQSTAEHHRPLAIMQIVCTALITVFALYTLTMDITLARVCVHAIGVCHPLLCAIVQWLWHWRGHSEHSATLTGANVVASCVAIAAVSMPQARQRAALYAHLCTVLAAQAYIIRRTRHMTMLHSGTGTGTGTYAPGCSPSIMRFRNESVLRWLGGWSFASARSLGAVPSAAASVTSAVDSAALAHFGMRTAVEPAAMPTASDMDTARSSAHSDGTQLTQASSDYSRTSVSGTSDSNPSSAEGKVSASSCHSSCSSASSSSYDTSINKSSCTSSCASNCSDAASFSSTQMERSGTASSSRSSDSSASSLYVKSSIDKLADYGGSERPAASRAIVDMLSVSPSTRIDVQLDADGDGASSMQLRNESATQSLAILTKVPPCEQLSVAPATAVIPPKGRVELAVAASVARPIDNAHVTVEYAPVPAGEAGRHCKWMLQRHVPVASRRIDVALTSDIGDELERMRTAKAGGKATAAAAAVH